VGFETPDTTGRFRLCEIRSDYSEKALRFTIEGAKKFGSVRQKNSRNQIDVVGSVRANVNRTTFTSCAVRNCGEFGASRTNTGKRTAAGGLTVFKVAIEEVKTAGGSDCSAWLFPLNNANELAFLGDDKVG
jgi:hypothetical protein